MTAPAASARGQPADRWLAPPEPLAGLPYRPSIHATEHPVIVTTTSSIEGKSIIRYCGIVTGEAVLGANLFKDLFAFTRERKKFWLLPILIMMVIFGGLIVLTKGSAIAPFIYTLF